MKPSVLSEIPPGSPGILSQNFHGILYDIFQQVSQKRLFKNLGELNYEIISRILSKFPKDSFEPGKISFKNSCMLG